VLLLETEHVLEVVTGECKKYVGLGENAAATDSLAHVTLTEAFFDKRRTARLTLQLTMKADSNSVT
jgi:hypothetical protein